MLCPAGGRDGWALLGECKGDEIGLLNQASQSQHDARIFSAVQSLLVPVQILLRRPGKSAHYPAFEIGVTGIRRLKFGDRHGCEIILSDRLILIFPCPKLSPAG
jgi:hypothetical protein